IKALEDRGINYSDIEIENIVLDWNQAFDFGKKVSQFQKNFSVFSVSDLVAWGFTEGCRVNNLISGRDYHIIGYDNCSFAEKIGLTTINQPISDLGTISAQKILEKINGSDRDENVVLNPDYVERNSN
ncbi:MAG TPA: substrate-binding domain-containing protein, partial [Tepiditoga sp.]|nr:substrate-binding domain-containing protein [Tepiditoga sp.]